ncbi:helix-turn-helix transcriptional regulator [Leifsonia poae]|nr:LuxR C-terminal-related transcriptional regulator [Leifsonia poae]
MNASDDHSMRSPTARTNVPGVPRTRFVGRTQELELVSGLLERNRLVTLTGPGGAGKTRLAVEVATSEASRGADGAYWVDLSTLADGSRVAEAIALAAGAPVVADQLRALNAHLATRECLLCIDNAEHLLSGVADAVAAVLQECPEVHVLVTSREPLGLAGEVVSGVPPLADEDAVELFVDRARLAQPAFALDSASEPAIRSIAAHLDGIPLALELAAAWMRTLSPQQVEAGLDDRFALLVRGPRGAQRRQLTLAGSIDWSYALLDEADRAVLRRLSVFAGSFGLDAAQYLCAGGGLTGAETLLAIGRLVDKSLIVAERRDGDVRYRLLETIRAYATARAIEAKDRGLACARQLAWCLDYVQAAELDREQDTDRWRAALAIEYDNLVSALEFGLAADDPTEGRRLAALLAWFWHFDHRGREGLTVLRRAIERAPDERSLLQARLLTGFALVADTAGPLDVEYDAASRALALADELGDDELRALCLNLLAVGAFYVDFDAAWRLCEQAHEAAASSGDVFVQGGSRALQSMILHLRDRHPEAESLADAAVLQALRFHPGILSTLLTYQADGALACGDPVRAEALAQEALLTAEPLGDYLRLGFARSVLAEIIALRGDLARAAEVLDPITSLAEKADVFVPGLDHSAALLASLTGDSASAIRWLQRSADSTERGTPTWIAGRALPRLGAALADAGRVDEAATILDKAVEVCRQLQLPGALAEALFAQAELAAHEADGLVRAAELHHEALTIRVDHGLVTAQLDSLEALASIGSRIKATPDGVRLLHAAQSARERIGIARSAAQQAAYDETVARLRPVLGDEVFEDAAAEGALLPLNQAVASARRMRGRRSRPVDGWASLTPTELQVAATVAEGLSNPQISARLFISRGTVKTHLSHIFAKLGVANRAELAAVAATRSAV